MTGDMRHNKLPSIDSCQICDRNSKITCKGAQ